MLLSWDVTLQVHLIGDPGDDSLPPGPSVEGALEQGRGVLAVGEVQVQWHHHRHLEVEADASGRVGRLPEDILQVPAGRNRTKGLAKGSVAGEADKGSLFSMGT